MKLHTQDKHTKNTHFLTEHYCINLLGLWKFRTFTTEIIVSTKSRDVFRH